MSRYGLEPEEIAALLAGEPPWRARQVHEALFRRLASPEEMTELPLAIRERLAGEPRMALALRRGSELTCDDGRTVKWLFETADGQAIETVLMSYPGRTTVCVSSQAGCAMGCTFCATGDAGFSRNLDSGEIVEQVALATRRSRELGWPRLANVVFMGMGEPLANFGSLWAAILRCNADLGIAARHLTVSTVGVVPGIRKLAAKSLQVNLALSLHAANDDLRSSLVPLNRRYPLAALMEACHEYSTATGRRISFEWAMIDGVNDRPSDARELSALAVPLRAHVNLIPLNPTPGGLSRGLAGSPPGAVAAFAGRLKSLGVNATVRHNRGRDIDAACGQLAAGGVQVRRRVASRQ